MLHRISPIWTAVVRAQISDEHFQILPQSVGHLLQSIAITKPLFPKPAIKAYFDVQMYGVRIRKLETITVHSTGAHNVFRFTLYGCGERASEYVNTFKAFETFST